MYQKSREKAKIRKDTRQPVYLTSHPVQTNEIVCAVIWSSPSGSMIPAQYQRYYDDIAYGCQRHRKRTPPRPFGHIESLLSLPTLPNSRKCPCTRSTSRLIKSSAFSGVQRADHLECKSTLVFCLKITCCANMKFLLRMLHQTTSEK